MTLREALQHQGPSLALQRAALDEIARLEAALDRSEDRRLVTVRQLTDAQAALLATAQALLPAHQVTPTAMAGFGDPWPQVARAIWPTT